MDQFPILSHEDNLSDMIERVYETRLDVAGGWGYAREEATRLNPLPVSRAQLQHNLAHMRVYLEMNITQTEATRYSGIDLVETARETLGKFECVTYRVTGILEKQYNDFIQEYKEGYGKEDFDISGHFARRKAATLTREIEYWFDLSGWEENA